MNKRLIIVMMAGLLFAGGASTVLYRVMMTRLSNSASLNGAPAICVALKDLDAGKVVKDDDVAMVPWSGPLPGAAILKKTDAVGRAVSAAIYRNEPVIQSRLAAEGAGAGLAAMIPPGMRALGVKVNEVVGVAGFVVPGTHVDVISSGSQASGAPPMGGATGSTLTKTILQNITVLSAGQDYKQDADGKPVSVQVVNLLVTPQQAELLSMAGNQTTIQLVLRNALDKDQVTTTGVDLSSLMNGFRPPAPTAPRPQAHPVLTAAATPPPPEPARPADTIEVIEGTKKTEVGLSPGGVR